MNLYIGTLLIACATLAVEISLTRILSVVTWYYLAYFAISVSMLGMTAGAIAVYFNSQLFSKESLRRTLAKAGLGFAWITPVALLLLCLVPLISGDAGSRRTMALLALMAASTVCALPFFFSGVAITGVLTRSGLPVGKIYAADLIGSSTACLLVLVGLRIMDPYSLIILSGAMGAVSAYFFSSGEAHKGVQKTAAVSAVFLATVALLNSVAHDPLRAVMVKGEIESPSTFFLEKWNSFSRVLVKTQTQVPGGQLWGPSPKWTDQSPSVAHFMTIDGAAGTVLRRFTGPSDVEHLRYDVTNIGYYLGRKGRACVIGVGGGRDVQSALLFGQTPVVGVDINPVFIGLLTGQFSSFTGLAGRSDVRLVTDEARSYFTHNQEPCTTMQMSLVDTWAATAAGAFSLAENGLYTEEAWGTFYSRLADNGFFSVSRWYSRDKIDEVDRMISLAVATLHNAGVTDASAHIALIGASNIGTLVLSKRPFNQDDVEKLRGAASTLGFQALILPGSEAATPMLRALLATRTNEEVMRIADADELNISPPTDEKPYFFNLLRLNSSIFHSRNTGYYAHYVIQGNLKATLYLIALILILAFLTLVAIVIPLVVKTRFDLGDRRGRREFLAGGMYFSLIGAGFMFVEIAMIQRLNIYLGHPVYSLAVLLFTLILSTGCGSLLSELLAPRVRSIAMIYPMVVASVVLFLRFAITGVIHATIVQAIPVKIIIAILTVFPIGMLLGICFPLGMRLVPQGNKAHLPWYWALNGIFGVLSSCVAVLISIYLGVSISFYIGAACYAALLISNRELTSRRH